MARLDRQVSISTGSLFTAGELREFLDTVEAVDGLPLNAVILPQFDAETGEFSLESGTVLQAAVTEVSGEPRP